MTTRVIPNYRTTLTAYDRTYNGATGVPMDVPDSDALILGANGWTILGKVGSSSQRPYNINTVPREPFAGQEFIDTTLGAVIRFDGQVWRNPVTGAAV